jgi:hypothetical protein
MIAGAKLLMRTPLENGPCGTAVSAAERLVGRRYRKTWLSDASMQPGFPPGGVACPSNWGGTVPFFSWQRADDGLRRDLRRPVYSDPECRNQPHDLVSSSPK